MGIKVGEIFQVKKEGRTEIVRGRILALRKSNDEGIMLAFESNSNANISRGLLYLIKDVSNSPFPEIVKEVRGIPESDSWCFNI